VREVTVATSVRVETDSGEPIWARVVAGSTLGEPISSSLLDDRLRLMLAQHPQGNGWAIVVLEQLAEG
jgi:hypothetical protein